MNPMDIKTFGQLKAAGYVHRSVKEEMADISQTTDGGDFDYPRAVAGGLNAPFMSIYVPASFQETGGAREVAEELIAMVRGFEEQWPEKFAVATSVADLSEQFERGVISLPICTMSGWTPASLICSIASLVHWRVIATSSSNDRFAHAEGVNCFPGSAQESL